MRAAYDFWLFDLDGTVLDIDDAYVTTTISRVADALETTFTPVEARRLWFGRDGLRDDILREKRIDPMEFWATFHEVESPERRAAATTLFDDATAVDRIDGPRGVVTHCQSYLTEPILDRLAIDSWFDTVVCCSDTIGWKPDPAPVNRAIEALGVHGDGVLVGDSLADVGAAHNAGLDAILVARDDPPCIDEAEHVVSSLHSLVGM